MRILVINAGSSSIKYRLFDMGQGVCLAKGIVDRVGMDDSCLRHEAMGKAEYQTAVRSPGYREGLQVIIGALVHPHHGVMRHIREIAAVGHRVVHGAEDFAESVLIAEEVKAAIRRSFTLAPLHNPANLTSIQACQDLLPDIPHVAVFDTAFHQTMPPYAYLYAIPYELYSVYSIRRYGFHGTSHRYVASRAARVLDQPLDSLKMVTCHLGNGCSIAAVCNATSIDTSMGFTPLEGCVMGTRCGDLDPAVVFFLQQELGMGLAQIDDLLNRKSGLLGISGMSNDVREISDAAAKGSRRAKLALEMFSYRVRKYVGAYAAAMNGIDAVVFTGGIGENASNVRETICQGLGFLGVKLDPQKNQTASGERVITEEGSAVEVLVIPTDEERVIAQDTFDVVTGKQKGP